MLVLPEPLDPLETPGVWEALDLLDFPEESVVQVLMQPMERLELMDEQDPLDQRDLTDSVDQQELKDHLDNEDPPDHKEKMEFQEATEQQETKDQKDPLVHEELPVLTEPQE